MYSFNSLFLFPRRYCLCSKHVFRLRRGDRCDNVMRMCHKGFSIIKPNHRRNTIYLFIFGGGVKYIFWSNNGLNKLGFNKKKKKLYFNGRLYQNPSFIVVLMRATTTITAKYTYITVVYNNICIHI